MQKNIRIPKYPLDSREAKLLGKEPTYDIEIFNFLDREENALFPYPTVKVTAGEQDTTHCTQFYIYYKHTAMAFDIITLELLAIKRKGRNSKAVKFILSRLKKWLSSKSTVPMTDETNLQSIRECYMGDEYVIDEHGEPIRTEIYEELHKNDPIYPPLFESIHAPIAILCNQIEDEVFPFPQYGIEACEENLSTHILTISLYDKPERTNFICFSEETGEVISVEGQWDEEVKCYILDHIPQWIISHKHEIDEAWEQVAEKLAHRGAL